MLLQGIGSSGVPRARKIASSLGESAVWFAVINTKKKTHIVDAKLVPDNVDKIIVIMNKTITMKVIKSNELSTCDKILVYNIIMVENREKLALEVVGRASSSSAGFLIIC